jgi:RNA recognition motif-containing protein
MTDPRTGMTRGYGFVRFAEQMDQQRALLEMQGYFVGSRAIRVSVATPKNRTQQPLQLLQQLHHSNISTPSTCSLLTSPSKSPLLQSPLMMKQESPILMKQDLNNTTVFVGGLSAPILEEELRQYFQHFGEIVYVKIPAGKGCGFVQYVSRISAELAIQQMNGYQIGNSRIRLSWGRSQNEKTSRPLSSSSSSSSSMYHQHPQLGLYNTFSSIQQQQQQQQQQSMLFPTGTSSTSMAYHHKFLSNPTTDLLLDSTTDDIFGSILDESQQENNRNVDWRLNQIYAQ